MQYKFKVTSADSKWKCLKGLWDQKTIISLKVVLN